METMLIAAFVGAAISVLVEYAQRKAKSGVTWLAFVKEHPKSLVIALVVLAVAGLASRTALSLSLVATGVHIAASAVLTHAAINLRGW